MEKLFQSGFVNIIGKPNAGKSTLLNLLIEQPLCIVNPKAQTTRHRIRAILNGPQYQIIFSDTPGIMLPANKLHERMLHAVDEAFDDADILIYVHDIKGNMPEDSWFEKIKMAEVPKILVLNKMDLADQSILEEAITAHKATGIWNEIIPVSALHNFNIQLLIEKIILLLPESPPYFDTDEITDRNERFFVTEIIRERMLAMYNKEIPYSCEVGIERYVEEKTITKIYANIYVMRESQKAIVLGNKGLKIKQLGTESRKNIEAFIQQKVFLELTVKVRDNWRNDDKALTSFGY